MNESAFLFGPDRRLMGVLTQPTVPGPQSFGCLLLNVGVTHRVGPRRLNVKLARRLADQGVLSLRMDLSGIGDSPASSGRTNFREQAIRDLQSAMDLIESSTGIKRFVVIGICSGATNGYWLSLADPRVTGLLMFDGFVFPTFKTRLRHDWQKLRQSNLKTILRKGSRRLKRLLGADSVRPAGSIFNTVSDLSVVSKADFADAMERLTVRGVAIFLIYSGSLLEHYNYHTQLDDCFRGAAFLSHIRHAYLPDVDHIATPLAAQARLLTLACQWVAELPAPEDSWAMRLLSTAAA